MPTLEFCLEIRAAIAPPVDVGPTPYGHRRRIDITGGSVSGPTFSGRVLPGGADWQLTRADGLTLIEADYMIAADDGVQIHVRNRGLAPPRQPNVRPAPVHTTPVFEAPDGPHDWLNRRIFVGRLSLERDGALPTVVIRIFRVV